MTKLPMQATRKPIAAGCLVLSGRHGLPLCFGKPFRFQPRERCSAAKLTGGWVKIVLCRPSIHRDTSLGRHYPPSQAEHKRSKLWDFQSS